MFPTRHSHVTPCSCNECVYKTRAESSNDKSINGSRIDKLYYNKYLPLRERKLIDKLVRTRAVYDDIRNRILSNVDVNQEDNTDKRKAVRSEDSKEAETIHELVNLVDRGELSAGHSSVNMHSDCCNCCQCKSKVKVSRPHKVHMHIPSLDHVHQYLAKQKVKNGKRANRYARSSQSDSYLSSKATQRKITGRQQYARPMLGGLYVEAEYQKSDKKEYTPKAQHKNLHAEIEYQTTDKKVRTPKERLKDVHIQFKDAGPKKCECVISFKKLDVIKSSMEIKNRTSQLKQSFFRDSVTKIENAFNIKKDSISLFREKLRNKEAMKKWICKPDFCTPDECVPADCYEEIKKKYLKKKTTQQSYRKRLSIKSNLQKVICKCKRLRKSTGSMTNITATKKISANRLVLKPSRAAHELERCFCTLQLKKPPVGKVKKPVVMQSSKATIVASFNIKPKPSSKATLTEKLAKPKNVASSQSIKAENVTKQTAPPVVQQRNVSLLPYECEPMFCVPGECDPLVCEKRIMLRNLTNSNSVHSQVNPVPKKAKITSASVTKSPPKMNQTRAPKRRNRPTKPKQKKATYTAKTRSYTNAPSKQVVRIGSSFRFDVEFFKEKNSPDTKKTVITNNSYVNAPRIKSSYITSETKDKYVKPQRRIAQKQTHYDERINAPQLKRCFCTLKLQKNAKNQMIEQFSSKETMTKQFINKPYVTGVTNNKSSMTPTVVNYVIPPKNYADLLPYECEPFFCTPGQCDPYQCEKRIKMRNVRSKAFATNTTMPTNSTSSGTFSNNLSSRSTGTHPTRQMQRRVQDRRTYAPPPSKPGSDNYYTDQSRGSINASHRQAVRVGSTFRFDIEFSKTKINPNGETTPNVSREGIRYARERPKTVRRREKGQGIDKNHRYRQIERGVGGGRQNYNEIMSQTDVMRGKSKHTATETLLKRCFCTLTLKKANKNKMVMADSNQNIPRRPMHTQTRNYRDESVANVSPPVTSMPHGLLPYECEPNFCIPGQCDPIVCDQRIKQRNKEMNFLEKCFCTMKLLTQAVPRGERRNQTVPQHLKTTSTVTPKEWRQKNNHKLLPYECEPGVCKPGNCDPYQCIKLIDRRNMKLAEHQNRHANTLRPKGRAVHGSTSITSRGQETQSDRPRRRNQMQDNRQRNMHRSDVTLSSSSPSNQRQAVKISSQISFNIEFYKNKVNQGYKDQGAKDRRVKDRGVKDQGVKDQGYKNQGNKGVPRMKRGRGQGVQGVHISKVSGNTQANQDLSNKSSYTEPRLERCFCTLKLQKKGRGQKPH